MDNNTLSRIISEVIDNFIAMNNIGIDISKIPLETLKKDLVTDYLLGIE